MSTKNELLEKIKHLESEVDSLKEYKTKSLKILYSAKVAVDTTRLLARHHNMLMNAIGDVRDAAGAGDMSKATKSLESLFTASEITPKMLREQEEQEEEKLKKEKGKADSSE